MKINFYNKKNEPITVLDTAADEGKLFESCVINAEILKEAHGELKIRCEIPIIDLHGFWSPDIFRPEMKLGWKIEFSCAAHRNFPYLSFFNFNHRNRATIATSNLLDDSVLSAKMNQQSGNYDVEICVSIDEQTGEFSLFIDLSDREWPEVMHDFRKWSRPGWTPSYPGAAWLPVYCTWYAVHAAVEKQWLDKQADTAAAMGFGTFIVDDGWCFDEMRRVSPETIANWYEKIGDWLISEKQLPDFKSHVERVRKLGLKYLLWVSPFMVGMKSRFMAETKCAYLTDEHEGYRVFDPADTRATAKSMKYMLDTVNNYGLDGLKIDFVDAVPQSVKKPRGREVFNYIDKLLNTIKKANPEALIEFRQRYATPLMLDQATQFRAGDVPFDFIENLHRIAQIRICVGDKVPVHADPVYWNPEESPVNIARHMICSLAGVPMVSMDLDQLPSEQRAIIEYWLEFYRKHLSTFRNGHWQVKYQTDHLAAITVEDEAEKIIFLCSAGCFNKLIDTSKGKNFILNLTAEKLYLNNCMASDLRGRTVPDGIIPIAGSGLV